MILDNYLQRVWIDFGDNTSVLRTFEDVPIFTWLNVGAIINFIL